MLFARKKFAENLFTIFALHAIPKIMTKVDSTHPKTHERVILLDSMTNGLYRKI